MDDDEGQVALDLEALDRACRVVGGRRLDLGDHDPRGTPGWSAGKEEAQPVLTALNGRLQELQELLHADGRERVLLVLQAMDTGGKDSTIRRVFSGVNPQGVRVASFGRPSPVELAHDYLWRVHSVVPADGRIVVFNRSHYEDVLVVRVHGMVPEDRWRRRYGHIRDFERMLADEGTSILKVFLNISRDEQRERLQDRIDDPQKHWKFRHGDLDERARWPEYMAAFEEALAETSADHAPWYVIPAERKWYRDLAVSALLVRLMEGLDLDWPPPEEGIEGLVVT